MATSGSYDFSMTRNEVIAEAYSDARILGADQTPTNQEIVNASRRLNMIVKQWQGMADFAPGLKVFSRKRLHLFLAKGQQRYLVGPATTDSRCTEQYGRTTISTTEAGGQTVLSITSTTDATTFPPSTLSMTANDIIGIQLDDGTLHWSTISTTGAGPTVTINDALASQASAGKYVWWFTSRAQRFPDWEAVLLRDSNFKDVSLLVYKTAAAYENSVSDKYGDGDPTAVLIESLRINTAVTLNRQPTDVTKQLVLTVLYPAEDYDSASDDIAFPAEWFRPLSIQLGMDLWPKYKSGDIPQSLILLRNEALSIAQNVNPQVSDECFDPDREGHA